jgi:HAE1 family hydrophobic/amphiphilic exporter-1
LARKKAEQVPEGHLDAENGGFTALFVRRPVLAIVANLLIVVAGLAALAGAEIRELPEVDSPVITVSTDFAGAAPETIDRELTAPIEGAAARVAGVRSISSSSGFGTSRVTVEFTDDTDLDIAASDLRDAISRVARDLPEAAEDPRIVKADANADAVMRIAVTSADLSVEDITILVEDQVIDRLSAVTGVADVQIYGDREKIFRVDVDQAQLAARGLTVGDLATALGGASFDTPAGSLTSNSQDLVVRAESSVDTPEEFESLVLRDRTRVADIATVTLGPDPGEAILRANGVAGVGLGIIRQAGSNTLEISTGVREVVDEIAEILPDGVEIKVTSDEAKFVNAAIHEVLISLLLAAAIVIAIIYLFLGDWRATIIPAVTLPVALIGAVAGIWIAGFSINILTLLALVLATGIVVDDAIVVLENIVTHVRRGDGPRAAAVIGTREVFFAVIATTATLAAVFIPISFLPGKAGGLFTEFGFTLAISVLLSSFVALTLCPMLASRLLRSGNGSASAPTMLERFGASTSALYGRTLKAALNAPIVVLAATVFLCAIAVLMFSGIRKELTPSEDRAVALMTISAPQGVSLDYTSSQLRIIEALVEPLRERGEIENVFAIAGRQGQANSAFMVLTLAEWGKRERSQQEIVAELNRLVAGVPGVRAFPIQPNSLGIRGAGSGLQVALVGEDYGELAKAADRLVDDMEKDPRFGRVRLGYETTQPQLSIDIDRERASDLGINIEGLAPVVQAMLDGRAIGSVFIGDRAVDVKLVSTTNPVNDPTDLENVFLKTADNRIVPMSAISRLEEKAVAPSLGREQKLRAVQVTASLTPDFPLQQALDTAKAMAGEHLPAGYRVIPLSEAATLEETSGGFGMVIGFALIVVLLVLAAQFESFVSAFIIMFTVPLGIACAVFALWMTGTSLNVYSQIGLVLLVGIMAKNGILIVEFANQLRDARASVREAIEQASLRRLRPVVMTMVSTVLGGVPLVLAVGAGAEARIALGWVIVGGLGLATFATLYLTPVAYLMLARFSKPQAHEAERLARELRERTA